MAQVIRWLIPSLKTASGRNAMTFEVDDVLSGWLYQPRGFDASDGSAEEQLNLVGTSISEDVLSSQLLGI